MRITKRLFAMLAVLIACVAQPVAQTTIDIAARTRGNLPIARLVPGVAGQCLTTDVGGNTSWGSCAAGSGTVTTFSAGNVAPLFTCSVSNPTTTPALTCTISNAAAHTFFGNNTGSPAAPGYVSITAADLPGVFAQTIANASHKWLNSYDAGTGLFTQTQPAYSDLTGVPTLAATKTAVASNWLNSYDSTTGLFTATRPAYTDLTGLPQLAVTKTAVASNWIRSYDSTTGLFTASQPDYSDLTGTPTLPATLANAAHKWLNSYNSTTGLFTQTQPDYSDLTGTAPVTSVFGRSGAVTAASADYTAAQVTNAFDVTVANTLTNVTAPSTPAAGKTAVYVDSTNKVLSSKNDAGTVSNTVVPDAGAANNFLTAVSAAGVISKAQPSFSNISGSVAAAQLPNPSATTLGGIESLASVASKWINTISTSGVPSATQPAFTDISGSATCAQLPALTGNVTSSAGSCATTIAAGVVTRAELIAGAKNWAFCGTATAAATTVGPVSASTCCSGGLCRQFIVMYQIAGYNGGTPVGRLLTANGTISTTALTNSFSISENVTAPSTGSGGTAIPGLPLAVTLSAIGRSGQCFIDGASGSLKVIRCEGTEGTPSVATAPTLYRGASFFSDLGTNLALANFQLSVYDTLTATAVSAQAFTSGTYLAVWGRNTD